MKEFWLSCGHHLTDRNAGGGPLVTDEFVKCYLARPELIKPVTEMGDVSFNWYLGLDAVGAQIGDTLWNGSSLDQRGQASVVGLYQLKFEDPTVVAKNIRSEPVYLILAMTPDKALHMKPQNLLTGLPIRHPEPVN